MKSSIMHFGSFCNSDGKVGVACGRWVHHSKATSDFRRTTCLTCIRNSGQSRR